jgi:hypothetical protein
LLRAREKDVDTRDKSGMTTGSGSTSSERASSHVYRNLAFVVDAGRLGLRHACRARLPPFVLLYHVVNLCLTDLRLKEAGACIGGKSTAIQNPTLL